MRHGRTRDMEAIEERQLARNMRRLETSSGPRAAGSPCRAAFSELLIDRKDRTLRAVLVGMLREAKR